MTIIGPRRLRREDTRQGFSSGAPELDDWLERYAWQNQATDNAVTYVFVDDERIVGYYAIAMAAVSRTAAPEELSPGRRPAQIPCILLARLAVDRGFQNQGLGRDLLKDALLRSVMLAGSIGAAAVLVHCRDEPARAFYLGAGDFLPSPAEDLHLMVPIKTLRKYVAAS
ncbi:MAG: GNAT family N-acetyltransferase [Propionibacteriaceae bacterium]|jgi:GNAT superfamily N-acetyltransferase|nr:GNAT family N-acetyltransferase [Propionibacteriaceae bacterium]